MANPSLKDTWTILTVVAELVRAVAKLATAIAVTNGRIPAAPELGENLLDEVLGQLDAMLVLGTHIGIHAEKLAQGSGAVQRLRASVGKDNSTALALAEIRELIATMRLQRMQDAEEGNGPDTDRSSVLAAEADQDEPWLDARLRGE